MDFEVYKFTKNITSPLWDNAKKENPADEYWQKW